MWVAAKAAKDEKQTAQKAKQAKNNFAERRVSPMGQNEPQNLESADSHSAD